MITLLLHPETLIINARTVGRISGKNSKWSIKTCEQNNDDWLLQRGIKEGGGMFPDNKIFQETVSVVPLKFKLKQHCAFSFYNFL